MICNNMYICVLVIIVIIFISIHVYNKYFVTPSIDKPNSDDNEYYYPNYPNIYTTIHKKMLTSGLNNYKLDDRGGMYVWISSPTMPIYIPCRQSQEYKDMCDYVIGNTKPIISYT